MMTVLNRLASALDRRDEVPNQELAYEIAQNEDKDAVAEIIANFRNKDRNIQSDCIKTIYEVAVLRPDLVSAYIPEITELLVSKNNRMQWGAMTALNALTNLNQEKIYQVLPNIIAAADSGTVITNDHCVSILIKLCGHPAYSADAFALLLERLRICPTNQLPMYAENAMPIINDANRTEFVETLWLRLGEVDKEPKRARIQKVLRKLG